jgi:transcription termination/antitermination protein NusA
MLHKIMSEIVNAIKTICEEKGLSYQAVLETINAALAAAYRKDFGEKNQNIKVEFDPENGKSRIFDIKTVVEDFTEEELLALEQQKEAEYSEPQEGEEEGRRFNPKTEMQISEAKQINKDIELGEELKMELQAPEAYGRMAAQTAKQVIIQKIREAERDMVFSEFKDKEHEVVTGVVQRREPRLVLVDLGKAVGVLPREEQIPGEKYEPGSRVKVYVKSVGTTSKGPEILLSRTSEEILRKIFYLEIPEVSNGLIEIKSMAREAGSRSKIAISANSENVDPIGSCVGQRGSRIQTIISELGGEKVDIIEHDEDPSRYITNALSPAKIMSIKLDDKNKKAEVSVGSDQLSLAIGKGGQNVRLAARLTGWKIDIVESGDQKAQTMANAEEEAESEDESEE